MTTPVACGKCRQPLLIPDNVPGPFRCPKCSTPVAVLVTTGPPVNQPAWAEVLPGRPRPAPPLTYRPGSYHCPFCHTTQPPWVGSYVTIAGWALLVILLVALLMTCGFLFAPLCLIGLTVRGRFRRCSSCGIRLD